MNWSTPSYSRRILAFLLSIALMGNLFPASAYAEAFGGPVEDEQQTAQAYEEMTQDDSVAADGPASDGPASDGPAADDDDHSCEDVVQDAPWQDEMLDELASAFAYEVEGKALSGARGKALDDTLPQELVKHAYLLLVASLAANEPSDTEEPAFSRAQELKGLVTEPDDVTDFFWSVLDKLQVEALKLRAVDDVSRTWLMVCLDDAWYHVDPWRAVVWAKASRDADGHDGVAGEQHAESISDWLCVSDARMKALDPEYAVWTLETGGQAPEAEDDYDWGLDDQDGNDESDDRHEASETAEEGIVVDLRQGQDERAAESAPDERAAESAPDKREWSEPWTVGGGREGQEETEQDSVAQDETDEVHDTLTVEQEEEAQPLSQLLLGPQAVNVANYSYTVRPMMEPFNYFVYVRTDNPDPTSFRLIDKSSRYTDGSNASGDTAVYAVLDKTFCDVRYENAATYRVNGGYIFYDSTANNDGGMLTVQAKNTDGSYVDTNKSVSCPPLKRVMDYLLENCTEGRTDFFGKLDAIVSFLDTHAIYPNAVFDTSKPSSRPYPFLATSPYYELSLNEHFEMYQRSDEGMLLKYMYPLVLDSLGYPGTVSAAAKRLDSTCTTATGVYHASMNVTYNGETRGYYGAGIGGRDPVFSSDVRESYLFDGSAGDAVGESLVSARDRLLDYKTQATAAMTSYRSQLSGEVFANKIGMGSWIRTVAEGWSGTAHSYAYVLGGLREGETHIASDAWVDGRYVSRYEKFEPGETFDQHPEADIVIRGLTYEDRNGQTCTHDALFRYDGNSETWRAESNYEGYALNVWRSYEDMPDELVLTREEVEAMGVDRNTLVPLEDMLAYDGTVEPGTYQKTVHVSSISIPTTLDCAKGDVTYLNVEILPDNADFAYYKVESDDESIVKLNGYGGLEALGLGTTKIRVIALDGGKVAECTVRVHDPVKSATLDPLALKVGETKRLQARIEPATAVQEASNWRTYDTDVVTVDKDGNVRGVGIGTARVYCDVANYGSVWCDVTVSADINGARVSPISDREYNGGAHCPRLTVYYGTRRLYSEYGDYNVTYANNVNAGTATVTLTGKGSFVGTKKVTFKIKQRNLSQATVTVSQKQTYTGNELRPSTSVRMDGKTLKAGTDYSISYKDNVKAGTAVVTVTGKGNYSGANHSKFTITKAPNSLKVKTSAKKVKLSKVKKKAQKVAALSVSGARGKVTYSVSKWVTAKAKKYFSLNKSTGKVTVKKKTPKGTYKFKVKVAAKGNANYKAGTKTVTVKISVK